jgi:hypothetical protein
MVINITDFQLIKETTNFSPAEKSTDLYSVNMKLLKFPRDYPEKCTDLKQIGV